MTVATASYVLASSIAGDLTRIATGSLTASVTPSVFSVVSGSSTEFVVTGTGVTIGSAITDTHSVTGSLGITGSLTMSDTFFASGSRSGSLVDLRQTWNTAGNVTGLKLNIVNPLSSGASSNLVDIQTGGTSVFSIDRAGICQIPGSFGTTSTTVYRGLSITLGGGFTGNITNINSNPSVSSTAANAFVNAIAAQPTFAPTTGSANMTSILSAPTVNQTGGASGITRGLYINPTLTSAADFRAIEVNSGSLVMADSYVASGSLSGSLVSLTHLTNTTGNVTSLRLNASGSAGASSNLMDLQVAGTSSFTVSRTGAVTMNTFASNAAFSYTNGGITYLTYQPNTNTLQVGSSSSRGTVTAALLTLTNSNTSTTTGVVSISNPKSTTAGTVDYVTNTSTIAPTTGSAVFNGYVYAPTINQTGGANGITRGLLISASLTSAADFRAIETTQGRVLIGSVSSSAVSITGSVSIVTGSTSALTISGITTGSSAAIVASGYGTKGGNSYFDFLSVTNTTGSATNPTKWFRVDNVGSLQIISSNYATASLALSDAGDMSINGSLTMTNRPAFRVYGSGTTNALTTTQNGDGTLNSNNFATDYTQGTGFSASTGIFTAPIAGLYHVDMIARNAGNASYSQLIAYKNNSIVIACIEFAGTSTMNHAGASSIAKLAVGDTLRIKVAAGTITFDGNDSWAVAYIG